MVMVAEVAEVMVVVAAVVAAVDVAARRRACCVGAWPSKKCTSLVTRRKAIASSADHRTAGQSAFSPSAFCA